MTSTGTETILHIAHRSGWEHAQDAGFYAMSTRGATLEDVGFIHGSTPGQVTGVAQFIYADDTEPLVVLVLDADAIRGAGVEIRYEDGGDGELYPHIYGPIRTEHVLRAEPAGFVDDAFVWGNVGGVAGSAR